MKYIIIDKELKKGILYVLGTLIFFGFSNLANFYFMSKYPILLMGMKIIVFSLLILPLYIWRVKYKWRYAEIGFDLNLKSVVVTILLVGILSFKGGVVLYNSNYVNSIVEGVMRTGEEFYFRGFIYYIIIKLYENKNSKNIRAMIFSSLAFTLAHTTIFIGQYHMGFFSMFLNTFLIFSTLRYYCKSLLPSIVLHTFFNGGLISAIIGVIIFMVIAKLADYKM